MTAEGQDTQLSLCPFPSNQETQAGARWSRPQGTLTGRQPGNAFCWIFAAPPCFSFFGPINIAIANEDVPRARRVSMTMYLTGFAMSCKIFMAPRFQKAGPSLAIDSSTLVRVPRGP